MNSHREYYRARVLKEAGFTVVVRQKQIEIPCESSPITWDRKVIRANNYLKNKGWNLQVTLK